ncbi:hypothetical protein PPERSA_12855 [Pseudocohnilembus persalinus]|uniref:Uncharacterized protein n=1 Tax=Pseudocohnilembus persalinus TaxID=266149 RepID=A0A0V0QVE7_PSEPJ|nr:hypothetical protein PPERSA_12855 [Pseudocohnilembus persalinus]|eukprot:KRX06166.1 hypothetical protein PPERSA_12855 [Pseudocohnilembus persalinus]
MSSPSNVQRGFKRTETGIKKFLKQFSNENHQIENNLNKIQRLDNQINNIKEDIEKDKFTVTRILDFRNADLTDEQYKEMQKKKADLEALLKEKAEWEAEQKRIQEEQEKIEREKQKKIYFENYQQQQIPQSGNRAGIYNNKKNVKFGFQGKQMALSSQGKSEIPEKFKNARKCQCIFTRKDGCNEDDCVHFKKDRIGISFSGLPLDHPYFLRKRQSQQANNFRKTLYGNQRQSPTRVKSMAKISV